MRLVHVQENIIGTFKFQVTPHVLNKTQTEIQLERQNFEGSPSPTNQVDA